MTADAEMVRLEIEGFRECHAGIPADEIDRHLAELSEAARDELTRRGLAAEREATA